MQKLRIIQWTTGKVGKLSLRGVIDDPRLELVGVYCFSPDKAGMDAGALCGRPETGIKASNDIDALIALKADSVFYNPFMADLDHVIRLLEGGMDVLSTNLFLNVGGIRGEVEAQLEAACQRGKASLYISGVNPGWVNAMACAMTGVCRNVQMVAISEAADCSVYESAETWQAMGMGVRETTPEVMATAKQWMMSFYDAVQRIAGALHYTLDDMEFFMEHATASETVDLGWFCMEKGTNAALCGGWNGKVKGKTVIQMKVSWYLTKKLNKDWVFPDEHYEITIHGEPEIRAKMQFVPPEHWGNHEWDTMTAMPVVNAALDVKAARPGILTLKDVGLTIAPAGVWASVA
jgi:hypothetical protein